MTKKSHQSFIVFGAPQIKTTKIDKVIETLLSEGLDTDRRLVDTEKLKCKSFFSQ